VQAVAVFDNARTARDVLVINPRVGQAASAVTAMVSRSSPDNWVLNVTSEVALRYVEVDIPGWTPGDNYFDLAPRLPHQVLLAREGGSERPTGTVDSIDLITRVPVQTCE
jgi:beta-mannosidase